MRDFENPSSELGQKGSVGDPAPPEDTRLVRRVLARDAGAFDDFVVRMKCVPRILSRLNARLGRPVDEHELADLSQEVLIIVWKKLPTFDGKASLDSWVYRIAFLTIMNAMRRRRRHSIVALGFEETDTTPSEERESPWDVERLQLALEELPEEERQIIVLKHFQEMTFVEIGQQLEISDNTAKTRYYRARLHLQEVLERPISRDALSGEATP